MRRSVVVLGFGLTSLGIARCLAGADYEVTAVGTRKRGYKAPLLHSRIPARKVVVPQGKSIVDALVDLRGSFGEPPLLILAEDPHVMQVSQERERIASDYRFLLPDKELVATLMDKQRFTALAEENGLTVPRTVTVDGPGRIPALLDELPFPFVLKPYLLHSQIVHDEAQLSAYIDSFEPVQWESVVAQSWIPGDAGTLFWCLAYLDESSRCVAHVTGNKVRLWPPQSGNSSLCRTCANSHVTEETVRVLETLGFVGFASVEFKYDARDDTYYILEPTVGRCDQQVAISRAAGVNLPEIGLRNLVAGEAPDSRQRDDVMLIWELWDLIARWHPRQDYRGSYLKHLFGADVRMLSDPSDLRPLFASAGSLVAETLRAAGGRIGKVLR